MTHRVYFEHVEFQVYCGVDLLATHPEPDPAVINARAACTNAEPHPHRLLARGTATLSQWWEGGSIDRTDDFSRADGSLGTDWVQVYGSEQH